MVSILSFTRDSQNNAIFTDMLTENDLTAIDVFPSNKFFLELS